MTLHLKKKQGGFTLIELLIVVAIIGLLAAMLIPNMLDALQKAKQKRTMADARLVGTAMMAWLSDEASAGAAGQNNRWSVSTYSELTRDALSSILVPQYIQEIPELDGWRVPYEYRLNVDSPESTQVMAVRSFGRDKTPDGDSYTAGAFRATDYDEDIVWADGFFVRWPQGQGLTND